MEPGNNTDTPKATPALHVVKSDPANPKPSAAMIAAGAGVDVSDEQASALWFRRKGELEKLLAAKKLADKAVQDHGKKVKADCGDNGYESMKFAIRIGASDDGHEKAKAEVQAKLDALRWLGLPMGTQASMFSVDRRPIEEKAYADGRIAGLEGNLSMKDCPHDAATPAFQEWTRGYHDGQGYQFDKMKGVKDSAEVLKDGAKKEAAKKAADAKKATDAAAKKAADKAPPKSVPAFSASKETPVGQAETDRIKAAADRAAAGSKKVADPVH